MLSSNSKLNIILFSVCVVLVVIILYILSYRKNIESINVYFNVDDIKNITWKNDKASFRTDGKSFTLIINDEVLFDKAELNLDPHTGKIVEDRLYIRSVSPANILIWYEEAEYRLNKTN